MSEDLIYRAPFSFVIADMLLYTILYQPVLMKHSHRNQLASTIVVYTAFGDAPDKIGQKIGQIHIRPDTSQDDESGTIFSLKPFGDEIQRPLHVAHLRILLRHVWEEYLFRRERDALRPHIETAGPPLGIKQFYDEHSPINIPTSPPTRGGSRVQWKEDKDAIEALQAGTEERQKIYETWKRRVQRNRERTPLKDYKGSFRQLEQKAKKRED